MDDQPFIDVSKSNEEYEVKNTPGSEKNERYSHLNLRNISCNS